MRHYLATVNPQQCTGADVRELHSQVMMFRNDSQAFLAPLPVMDLKPPLLVIALRNANSSHSPIQQHHDFSSKEMGARTKATMNMTSPHHTGELVNNHHSHSTATTDTVPPWHTMPWCGEQDLDDHTQMCEQKQEQDRMACCPSTLVSPSPRALDHLGQGKPLLLHVTQPPWLYKGSRAFFLGGSISPASSFLSIEP
jgi:hypothetical protein